ncbi:hypothetical protein ACFPZL_02530 [Leucobacter soli]|uniref:Uncharacterized protein n=1 Tax=Leucobacter soli TaxID=2812850 RepID=A0A916JV36_9MICO|nr:hypothetical protein [Leucobacter soli]CAG7605219.1 hypothetical protein LEUCIP111803_00808 [Leucobacter soli]
MLQQLTLAMTAAEPLRVTFYEPVDVPVTALEPVEASGGAEARLLASPGDEVPTPSRLIGEEAAVASAFLVVVFEVAQPHRRELLQWFVDEHVPLLQREPAWLRTRIVAEGADGRVVAIHSLADRGALTSSYRRAAGETRLAHRILSSDWFVPPLRLVFSTRSVAGPDAS